MNKIYVEGTKINSNFPLKINDGEIILENCDVFITYKDIISNYKFIIKNDVKIFEYYNNSISSNTYDIKENSNLTLNRFSFDCSVTSNINLKYKANLLYKYSCINKKDNNYVINVYHEDKDTTSKVLNYGINVLDNKLDFLINSYIKKQSINSNAIQDSKIIEINKGNSSIKPNLIIDNNEISSSHSAYIGDFKKDDIFYMQTRGISYDMSRYLLSKSFLISNIDNTELQEIIINDLDETLKEGV